MLCTTAGSIWHIRVAKQPALAVTRLQQRQDNAAAMTDAASRKPIRKAVFPVAGLGTRFLPATKAIPKEMLPIIDRPLIQYA
ncbi:MAG: hypothetical protein ACKOW1_08075, partial [Novosphingobium sp.]